MVSLGIQEFSSLWLVLGTISRGAPGCTRADSTSHPLGAPPPRRRHLSTLRSQRNRTAVSLSVHRTWTGQENKMMEAFIDPDGLLRPGTIASLPHLGDTCWWGLRKCRTTVPFVGLTAGQPGEQVKWPEISLSPSCNPGLCLLPFPNQAQVHPGSKSQGDLDRKAVERQPPASE